MTDKLKDVITKTCKLFQKFGIKSVSMDDIARECGISKKTLYESVKDKRELLRNVLDFEFNKDGNVPHNIDFANKNTIEVLFIVYQGAIEFFKDFNMSMEYDLQKYYPDLYAKTCERRRERIYKKIIMNTTQGIEEGYFRDDFNIDIIAKLHTMKIEALMQTDIFDDTDYTIVDIFKELFSHHFMAIATEKGVEAFKLKLKELNS